MSWTGIVKRVPLVLFGLLCGRLAVASSQDPPAFTLEEIVTTRNWGQFRLSPDGRWAVFTGVGRYFGHPLFPRFGNDNNLRIVSTKTGEMLQVTSGSFAKTYPRFSPDGRRIAYESEGDIWTVELSGGSARRLTTNVSADRDASWSPNASEIAFVSRRWRSSDLYVMDAGGEREGLRQLTDDGFRESRPTWSPDGKFVLFTSARDEHFYSRGIYRVPAAGGKVERLTPPDNARNNLPSFSPGGRRVAYISDRSGYLNIWTMGPDGTDHRQLTRMPQDQDYPENDHIQAMGLHWSPDGKRLLFFTNRLGNLDLMLVDVTTGKTEALRTEDGSHHPVGWVDNETVAFVYESYRVPPDLHVQPLGADARQLTFSGHTRYRTEAFDRLESVRWLSEDGIEVHGYLRRPSRLTPGERVSAIVMSHTYNVGQFYNQWNPIFAHIVQSGYVMLMVNHRGSNGYGVAFRDLPKANWGFAQLKDLVSAAEFLRKLPEVDPERVGMMGYSMGGYLTMLAVTTEPSVFRAGLCIFGLGEITGDPERSSKNYVWHIGGTEAEKREAYRQASPITHVERMTSPLLILHSDGDPIEPVTKVYNFVHELEKHGKIHELEIYRNEAHGLRSLEHQLDSYQRVMKFLDRYLRN